MSTNAQYASTPKIGSALISTANTNRDGTGTLGHVMPSGAAGTRVEKIVIEATGTTTAGMVRIFETEGAPGENISSISFAGTTATVTTSASHGLSTGDLVTVQGARPRQYNVKDAAITVTGLTTFTYPMATAPTVNAVGVGAYFTTPAVPTSRLLGEVPVSAITPSGTVAAFSSVLNTANAPWLPLSLPPGYSLRASTHNAESFAVTAPGGDF